MRALLERAGPLWRAVAACALPMAGLAVQAGGPVPADPATGAVRIGVLSVLNDEETERQWQPLATGLQTALGGQALQLYALGPDALAAAAAAGSIDFVVTNPGHYVALEARHGATRIATQSGDASGDPAHTVGSAVVVRATDTHQPATLATLRRDRVAAVAQVAFGGYQLVAYEWLRGGLDADAGSAQRLWTGFPMERVADAVLSGRADAGVLRTCLLEQWVREGRVPAGALRVVPGDTRGSAPDGCQSSTPLYPGWAFAALARTPPDLARQVLLALLTLQPDVSGSRWSVPADYQRVHDVLRALQVEPYGFLRQTRPQALLVRYWYVIAGMVALLLAGVAYVLRVEVLVQRRTAELTHSLRERERMAQQLAQGQEAVSHLSRLSILGELSATLAHELNHPLATISNYAAALRRRERRGDLAAADLERGLEEIASESDRAARVVQGVRALARKRVPVRTPLVPAAVAADAVALFQGLLAQAPPVPVCVAPDASQACAWGDAQQVVQVLLNLLQNALDAHRAAGLAPDTSIAVHIARRGDSIGIAVHDCGAPLAPEARERLFEPFYTTKPDGLGLGLSICRGIAETHGGALHARPAQSPADAATGMVFELLLPLVPCTKDLPHA